MIYFVDEDHRKLRALVTELNFFGYKSKVINDADTAFDELSIVTSNEVDIVIIDVMLAVKINGDKSRYSRDRTDDYHKTGLLLIDDLAISNSAVFPTKAIFFTHASSQSLLAQVDEKAKKHKTLYLRKKDFNTALEFATRVDEIIKKKGA